MVRAPSWLIGLLALLLLAVGSLRSDAQGTDEYGVKAACLKFFCHYVDWPNNAVPGDDKMYVVGVLGPDPFGDHLDKLGQQTVKGKKIVVRQFKAIEDYKPCHILFIVAGADADGRLTKALATTKKAPVLLVGDMEGFAQRGSVVNFFIDDQSTVKFEINTDAAKRAGLTISSQLLRVARIVKDAKETK